MHILIDMLRPVRNERGGYVIEAAIVLPLFILGVMTLAFMIRITGLAGAVMQIAADETGRCALDSYAVKSGLLLEPAIESRIYEECADIGETDVKSFAYLTERNGIDGLISFTVVSKVDMPLPFPIRRGPKIRTGILARAWIGKGNLADPMPFEDMERDEDSMTVWVFPQRGERYHKETCLFVSNEPRQNILTDALRKHYTPCTICDSGNLPNGSLVYCYPAYGEVYHRSSCSQVDKYVVPMDLQDAESRGYSPCSKCGGI